MRTQKALALMAAATVRDGEQVAKEVEVLPPPGQ